MNSPLPPLNPMQVDVAQSYAALTDKQQLIIQSPTGSGKTFAFLQCLIDTIDMSSTTWQAVIIVPTKDLVMQIGRVIEEANIAWLTHLCLPWHTNMSRQFETLKWGKPHIIISQPERLLKIVEAKKLKPHTLTSIIYDEADSTIQDQSRNLMPLMKRLPRDAKKAYFSATYSWATLEWISQFWEFNHKPYEDKAGERAYEHLNIPPIKFWEVLANELKERRPHKCLIFCNKPGTISEVRYELEKRGIYPAGLDGNTKNEERRIILEDFQNAEPWPKEWPHQWPHANVLISTDGLTRGMDFKDVDLVVNYRLPFDKTFFIHRSGRTGRYGGKWTVLTLLTGKEMGTYGEWTT